MPSKSWSTSAAVALADSATPVDRPVLLKNDPASGETVWVGTANTVTPGTTPATDGWPLSPGESVVIDPGFVRDLASLYLIGATTAAKTVRYRSGLAKGFQGTRGEGSPQFTASSQARSPWLLFGYTAANAVVAGGTPQVIDSTTYSNLATLTEGTPALLTGSTGVYALKLPAGYTQARIRVLCQDNGSADNATATVEIGTAPALVADTGVSYALTSVLARAVMTFGQQTLTSQTKEPFTRTSLSGSSTLREADTVTLSKQYAGPLVSFGYAADNGSGEFQVPLDFATHLLFTWVARSGSTVDRLVIGVQLER